METLSSSISAVLETASGYPPQICAAQGIKDHLQQPVCADPPSLAQIPLTFRTGCLEDWPAQRNAQWMT